MHKTIQSKPTMLLDTLVHNTERMLRDRELSDIRVGDVRRESENHRPFVTAVAPDGRSVCVYLVLEKKVNIKYAREVLDAGEAKDVVMISTDGPTAYVAKECGHAPVQFLLAACLCVCVIDHCLVPKHRRVEAPPPGIAPESLPRLLTTDAVAQYYHWPVGTIVEIERRFGGHETLLYYRRVS